MQPSVWKFFSYWQSSLPRVYPLWKNEVVLPIGRDQLSGFFKLWKKTFPPVTFRYTESTRFLFLRPPMDQTGQLHLNSRFYLTSLDDELRPTFLRVNSFFIHHDQPLSHRAFIFLRMFCFSLIVFVGGLLLALAFFSRTSASSWALNFFQKRKSTFKSEKYPQRRICVSGALPWLVQTRNHSSEFLRCGFNWVIFSLTWEVQTFRLFKKMAIGFHVWKKDAYEVLDCFLQKQLLAPSLLTKLT